MALKMDKTLLKNPLAMGFGLGVFISPVLYYKFDIEWAQYLQGVFMGGFFLVMAYVYYKRHELVEPHVRYVKYFPLLFGIIGLVSLAQGVFRILN